MNVIPFRPARRYGQASPLRPPPALGRYGSHPESASDVDNAEDRRRMQQNIGAFLIVIAIVSLGAWLIDRLTTYSRTMACLEAGHRHCKPLDIEPASPWERSDTAHSSANTKGK
jgi:hypothetical protein